MNIQPTAEVKARRMPWALLAEITEWAMLQREHDNKRDSKYAAVANDARRLMEPRAYSRTAMDLVGALCSPATVGFDRCD